MGSPDNATFLHDGRATNVRDAILAHDGQAAAARAAFLRLRAHEQELVIRLINSI